jgi:hypothetical protein
MSDRRTRWIAGPQHAQTLIFLEQATISTKILTKGYMVAGGELWGEKRVGIKKLFPMPTITCLLKETTQGHMKKVLIPEGDNA